MGGRLASLLRGLGRDRSMAWRRTTCPSTRGESIMNYVPPRRSDGTIQKKREPLRWPKDRPFRILSIDGGGICGILPAAVLAELERRFLGGRPISGYFDMIAGTSTGGIIALALGAGMNSAAIRDIYIGRGGLIFPPRGWAARRLLQLRRSVRYGSGVK